MKLTRIITIIITIVMAVTIILPAAAQNMQQAGKTDCGILYVDTDSAKTVKKDGQYYLALAAEEKYTDQEFLKSLRQGEDMQKAASAIYLYLFDNRGSNYCIAAAYIIDDLGNVCADIGEDMEMKAVGKDKTMSKAYSMGLKALENRQRLKGRNFIR